MVHTSLLPVVILILAAPLVKGSEIANVEHENKRFCDFDACDSLVSKCLLNERCSCNIREPSCAKDCIDCLEEKFGKCCACVDLCPLTSKDDHLSHVGETMHSDEQLFEVLTEEDDINGRWSVLHDYAGRIVSHPELGQLELAYRSNNDSSAVLSHDTNYEKLKCTVAFMNRYHSMTKCKRTCTSMGAAFFRWFHEGCCECVGPYCLGYGIDEPRCHIEHD